MAKKTQGSAVEQPTRAELDEVLRTLPGEYKDADYVVNGLRAHFGDLFTTDDEAKVRELIKPPGTTAHTPEPETTPDPTKLAGSSSTAATDGAGEKSTDPRAQFEKKAGAYVRVLDWSRDAQNPVECSGYIDRVNSDGTIDVNVVPPEGIEPYVQVGLTECTSGKQKPGQWKRPD